MQMSGHSNSHRPQVEGYTTGLLDNYSTTGLLDNYSFFPACGLGPLPQMHKRSHQFTSSKTKVKLHRNTVCTPGSASGFLLLRSVFN